MKPNGCSLIDTTQRIVALIGLLAAAGCGVAGGGQPGAQVIDPGRTVSIGDGLSAGDSQDSDDAVADDSVVLDGGSEDEQTPPESEDETTGNDDPADDEEPAQPEPTTFLRVINFWGQPQEIYVDDVFIVLVMPGKTSDDFPIEPGFHTVCAYLIGMVDSVCEPLVMEPDEVNSWLLFGERI